MKKVNAAAVEELAWVSPKGRFAGFGKQISHALGRDPESTDLMQRHPFDVELLRVPAGKAPYPHHSHSAQWEFYYILSGSGTMRHDDGSESAVAGDAFLFKPREAHQIVNDGTEDLLVFVVADNPYGESYYYPDSGKVGVGMPERLNFRGNSLDYFDGEE